LPNPLPRLLVRHVEITQDTPGQWGGNCVATSIYSTNWPIECIAEPFRDLMERQIVESSSIFRWHRRSDLSRRAAQACGPAVREVEHADADLKLAAAVLADLRKLTGRGLRAYTNHSE
jgi:hypothetical protein